MMNYYYPSLLLLMNWNLYNVDNNASCILCIMEYTMYDRFTFSRTIFLFLSV